MNDAFAHRAVPQLDLLHHREAEPLRDAALELADDALRIDRLPDVLRRRDLHDLHQTDVHVDVDDGAVRREEERDVPVALRVRRAGGSARGATRACARSAGRAAPRRAPRARRPRSRAVLDAGSDAISLARAGRARQSSAPPRTPRAPRRPSSTSAATPKTNRRSRSSCPASPRSRARPRARCARSARRRVRPPAPPRTRRCARGDDALAVALDADARGREVVEPARSTTFF